MPRPSTWAFTVEVLATYSHSTQAADLKVRSSADECVRRVSLGG
jgi:hypothetical protein